MNQDQINQLIQMQQGSVNGLFGMLPWWERIMILLQVLSYVATTFCLPLIAWKLCAGNRKQETKDEYDRLIQGIRDRREAEQKSLSGERQQDEQHGQESHLDHSSTEADVQEQAQGDERYLPQG